MKGHKRGIISVNISPDGSRIITECLDNLVMIWDAKTGTLIGWLLEDLKIKGSFENKEFYFSPDRTRIVTLNTLKNYS